MEAVENEETKDEKTETPKKLPLKRYIELKQLAFMASKYPELFVSDIPKRTGNE